MKRTITMGRTVIETVEVVIDLDSEFEAIGEAMNSARNDLGEIISRSVAGEIFVANTKMGGG